MFAVTGCGTKEEMQNNNNKNSQSEQVQDNNTKEEATNNMSTNENAVTKQAEKERIIVEKVINCEGCVYAYFSDNRTFGSMVSNEEYTTDINDIKTIGGNQRHNFFGFILSDNKIDRAYSCILKDNKIYCIEGTTTGEKYESNIGVINQIFTSNQCKYISDGNTYTCTDGRYNARTTRRGDADLHFETSCRIVGSTNSTRIGCA